jgi:hypothetical protein
MMFRAGANGFVYLDLQTCSLVSDHQDIRDAGMWNAIAIHGQAECDAFIVSIPTPFLLSTRSLPRLLEDLSGGSGLSLERRCGC